MLLIDDLLLAPFKGLLWVFEQVHDAAQEEMDAEADAITEQLRQLYLLVESGQLTEAQFELQERQLLDRLDRVREREGRSEDDAEALEDQDGEDSLES